MNPALDAPWSRRRLWWTTVVAGLAQVLVVYLVSERTPGPLQSRRSVRVIRDVSGTAAERVLAGSWALSDPTIFALVHPRGFSGSVWGQSPPMEYQMPRWTDAPRWLEPEPARLGSAFTALVGEAEARKPGQVLPPPFSTPTIAAGNVRTQTFVRVEGDLPPLLGDAALRARPHTDILTNTVVRVLASLSGEVFSTALLAGSGSREADQLAVEFARTARFERGESGIPRGPADFRMGRLVFEWLTVEPGGTNAPAGKP